MEQERKNKEQEKNKRIGTAIKGVGAIFLLAATYLVRTVRTVSEAFGDLIREENEQSEKKIKEAFLFVLAFFGVLFGSMIVSLASFPLKVYPAGFALLSALGGTGKLKNQGLGEKKAALLSSAFLLTAFSGVLLSTAFLGEGRFYYLLSYLILFLTRGGITGGKFDDAVLSRVTFSAAISSGLGMILALVRGFTVNAVFGAVSMGILTPLLTYLLCGFYIFTMADAVSVRGQTRRRVYLEATAFSLIYLFLYSLREIEIFDFSLSFVLAVMLTLLSSRTRGALYGAAAGMIGGMACAQAVMAPALAVAGFFAGLFFEYSGPVAMMISFAAACGYSMYSEGFQAFALVTADYLCAMILFFPLLRVFPKETVRQTRSIKQDVMHRETMRRARQKLKNMSEAFSSLSEVFYTVSDTMKKPKLSETSRLVSDCCSEVCSRCALSGICWGEEHATAVEATTRLSTRLLAQGEVNIRDFDQSFFEKCKNLEELTDRINQRFGELNGNFLKNNKTRLLAGEYSSVSRLLKSTAGELDQELEYNPNLEVRAKKVLKELGILYRRVAVFGTREMKIDVYGVALERVNLASDQVAAAFGKEFDCLFDTPHFLMFEESVVMRLRRKRKLSLECAKSGCTKKGEAVSGDYVGFFETERDYFYSLICDGMGSGREAAFTSRLAAIFIEKLMHCATPKNVTLEMLNTFLMSKTDETFTTVDLLEIDLLSGEGKFIKAGAAPSFVFRQDRLHRIESRTPPAGVLYRMCAEQTSMVLKEGDYIIQLSDGAEGGDTGWLVKLLSGSDFQNAASLCETIFRAARQKGAVRDDLSISVVRVMMNR